MVYTSGSTNGTTGAYSGILNSYPSIAESFSVAGSTTLSNAHVGLWVYQDSSFPSLPATPTSLTWNIGTSPGGSDVGTGTATLTNSLYVTNGYWNVYNSTFPLSASLDSGTYWLSLFNAASTDPVHAPQWDIVGGPSDSPTSVQLYQNGTPAGNYYPLSFSLYGVPEPCSFTLLASGLLGLGLLYLRHRWAKA